MSFAHLSESYPQVRILRSSLDSGRLGHAYLFTGNQMSGLEQIARTLAKTLNCQTPAKTGTAAMPTDCCDSCHTCRRIDTGQHPDVYELRPESKLRQIRIESIRELIRAVHLKPLEARFKVGIITWADRLNKEAANAFLKTLEEPPPRSILLLLSLHPTAILETIRSRCLHLAFGEASITPPEPATAEWLASFLEVLAHPTNTTMPRYRLLAVLFNELAKRKKNIESQLTADSPLQKYPDIEPQTRERLETELAAAIEAEYRQQRTELLNTLLWWLRDVWLLASGNPIGSLSFPSLQTRSEAVANRISPHLALENLKTIEQIHRLLADTNINERLALETAVFKLHL